MTSTVPTATKLSLKFDKGSYTFSRIKNGVGNDKIYALAQAINSLQEDNPAQEIRKVVENMIVIYED